MGSRFDRWYEQEMRAPDGTYIRRLQDAPKQDLKRAADTVMWLLLFERVMFGTMYGIPIAEMERNAP